MADNSSGVVAIFAIFIIIVLGIIGYYFYTNEARMAPESSTTVIQNEAPATGATTSTTTTKTTE